MKVHRQSVDVNVAISPVSRSGNCDLQNGTRHAGEHKKKKTILRKISDEVRRARKRLTTGISLLAGRPRTIDIETNRAIAELQDANQQLQHAIAILQLKLVEVQNEYADNHRTGPSDGIAVKVQSGSVMCPPNEPLLLEYLEDSGDLERGTRLLIERVLNPGDVFVDVGSHIGLHTVAAANKLQGVGKVYAFEPSKRTYAYLKQTVSLNGFQDIIDTFQCAITDQIGEQQFYLAPIAGHQSLYPLSDKPLTSKDVETVRTTSLDNILPAGTIVQLLKIDAEGAEILAIRGARKIIQASPNIGLIVEFGPSHLERTNVSVASWFEAFRELGLVFRVIEPMSGLLEERSVDQLMEEESSNLFFARPESEIWAKLT